MANASALRDGDDIKHQLMDQAKDQAAEQTLPRIPIKNTDYDNLPSVDDGETENPSGYAFSQEQPHGSYSADDLQEQKKKRKIDGNEVKNTQEKNIDEQQNNEPDDDYYSAPTPMFLPMSPGGLDEIMAQSPATWEIASDILEEDEFTDVTSFTEDTKPNTPIFSVPAPLPPKTISKTLSMKASSVFDVDLFETLQPTENHSHNSNQLTATSDLQNESQIKLQESSRDGNDIKHQLMDQAKDQAAKQTLPRLPRKNTDYDNLLSVDDAETKKPSGDAFPQKQPHGSYSADDLQMAAMSTDTPQSEQQKLLQQQQEHQIQQVALLSAFTPQSVHQQLQQRIQQLQQQLQQRHQQPNADPEGPENEVGSQQEQDVDKKQTNNDLLEQIVQNKVQFKISPYEDYAFRLPQIRNHHQRLVDNLSVPDVLDYLVPYFSVDDYEAIKVLERTPRNQTRMFLYVVDKRGRVALDVLVEAVREIPHLKHLLVLLEDELADDSEGPGYEVGSPQEQDKKMAAMSTDTPQSEQQKLLQQQQEHQIQQVAGLSADTRQTLQQQLHRIESVMAQFQPNADPEGPENEVGSPQEQDVDKKWTIEEKKRLTEMKVLRVLYIGESNAGKTSIAQTVKSKPYKAYITAKDDRTVVAEHFLWMPDEATGSIFCFVDIGGHSSYKVSGHYFHCNSDNNLSVFCHDLNSTEYENTFRWVESTINRSLRCEIMFLLTKADDKNDCSGENIDEKKNKFTLELKKFLDNKIKLLKKSVRSAKKRNSSKREVLNKLLEKYEDLSNSFQDKLLVTSCYNKDKVLRFQEYLIKVSETHKVSLEKSLQLLFAQIGKRGIPIIHPKSKAPYMWQAKDANSEMGRNDEVHESLDMSEDDEWQVFGCNPEENKYIKRQDILSLYQEILESLCLSTENVDEDLKVGLDELHRNGLLMFFRGEPYLEDIVFHDLNVFVALIKCIFHHRTEDFLAVKNDDQFDDLLEKHFSDNLTNFEKDKDRLYKQGLMSSAMLQFLLDMNDCDLDYRAVRQLLVKLEEAAFAIDDEDEKSDLFIPYFVEGEINQSLEQIRHYERDTLVVQCDIRGNNLPITLWHYLLITVLKKLNIPLQNQEVWKNGMYAHTGKSKGKIVFHYNGVDLIKVVMRAEIKEQAGHEHIWDFIEAIRKENDRLMEHWWPGLITDEIIRCTDLVVGAEQCKGHALDTVMTKMKGDTYCCGIVTDIPIALIQPLGKGAERKLEEAKAYINDRVEQSKRIVINKSESFVQLPQVDPQIGSPQDRGKFRQYEQEYGHRDASINMQAQPGGAVSTGYASQPSTDEQTALHNQGVAGVNSQSQQGHQSDWIQLKDLAGPSFQQVHQQICGSESGVIPKRKQTQSVSNQVACIDDSRLQQWKFQQQMLSQGQAVVGELQQVKCNQTKILSQQQQLALHISNERQQLGDEIRTERQQLSNDIRTEGQQLSDEIRTEGQKLSVRLNEDKQQLSQQVASQGQVLSDQMFLQGKELSRNIALDAGDASKANLTYSHPVLQNNKALLEEHLNVTTELLHRLLTLTLISGDQHKKISAQMGEGGKQKLLLYCVDLSVIEEPGLIDCFIEALRKYGGGTNSVLATTLANSSAEEK